MLVCMCVWCCVQFYHMQSVICNDDHGYYRMMWFMQRMMCCDVMHFHCYRLMNENRQLRDANIKLENECEASAMDNHSTLSKCI